MITNVQSINFANYPANKKQNVNFGSNYLKKGINVDGQELGDVILSRLGDGWSIKGLLNYCKKKYKKEINNLLIKRGYDNVFLTEAEYEQIVHCLVNHKSAQANKKMKTCIKKSNPIPKNDVKMLKTLASDKLTANKNLSDHREKITKLLEETNYDLDDEYYTTRAELANKKEEARVNLISYLGKVINRKMHSDASLR